MDFQESVSVDERTRVGGWSHLPVCPVIREGVAPTTLRELMKDVINSPILNDRGNVVDGVGLSSCALQMASIPIIQWSGETW